MHLRTVIAIGLHKGYYASERSKSEIQANDLADRIIVSDREGK